MNNANLEHATLRIIEGASWKHQRVIVLVPAAKMLATKVAFSWWSLIFPPNQAVHRIPLLGMEVGHAYSAGIDAILAHPELRKWEFILTLEHDNIPPPDGLLKLLKRMEAHPEMHCIGGLYWTKGPNGVPQIWGDTKDPQQNYRPQPPKAGELVECCGTGMGFNLWRTSMFRDLADNKDFQKPYFETRAGVDGYGTQDLVFWGKARPLGFRCAIDCDVLVGHHDAASDHTW